MNAIVLCTMIASTLSATAEAAKAPAAAKVNLAAAQKVWADYSTIRSENAEELNGLWFRWARGGRVVENYLTTAGKIKELTQWTVSEKVDPQLAKFLDQAEKRYLTMAEFLVLGYHDQVVAQYAELQAAEQAAFARLFGQQ